MQTKDHGLLGKYLLTRCDLTHDPLRKNLFLLGCIEPDWNLVTYARGSVRYQFLHGHNAENARKHLAHLTERLLESGIRTPLQWFRFGAALHYLTDSFTFAHNACFDGGLREHRLYEKLLHDVFVAQLRTDSVKRNLAVDFSHEQYLKEQRSFQTDCRYILGASIALCHRLSISQAVPKPIRCLSYRHHNTYTGREWNV